MSVFFQKSNVVRPHPYTDSPLIDYDNVNEAIIEVMLEELMLAVSYMFSFLDHSH